MLTPEGIEARDIDKIMLLSLWSRALNKEKLSKELIFAGMGKPTFQINSYTVNAYLAYWEHIQQSLQGIVEKEEGQVVIDYGSPSGDKEPLSNMADAMTKWYGKKIQPEEILFTVGGAGALRVIFETFNEAMKDIPHYRVLTPFPHYTLYGDNRHLLHPVNVLQEKGYQLTINALRESIDEANNRAEKDGNRPAYLLLCNPNNPLGTVLSKNELEDIAIFMRENPDMKLVIDEAYAEMVWAVEPIPSIVEIAPDIKNRVTIIRSATKAHSAAGERMAMLMNFDPETMGQYRAKNISMVGHAPRAAQMAYSETMKAFGEQEKVALRNFYEPKVRYVEKRLSDMCALMADKDHKVMGAFYVMADLSDLMGIEIPNEAIRALGVGGKVQTSEALAYSLLFKEALMIAPGEYFGLPSKKGFCRITCSDSKEKLKDLMDRLDACLKNQRQKIKQSLIIKVEQELSKIEFKGDGAEPLFEKTADFKEDNSSHNELVLQIKALKELLSDVKVQVARSSLPGREAAALTLQNFFRQHMAKKELKSLKTKTQDEWLSFVDEIAEEGALKNYLLNLPEAERTKFKPWVERQASKTRDIQEDFLEENPEAKF